MRLNRLAVPHCVLALALSALACASQSGGLSGRPEKVENVTIETTTGTSKVTIRPDIWAFHSSLESPATRAWAVLPTAFDALNIPIERLDSAHHYVSGSVRAYRRFQNRPLSQFVDCGSTIVGQSADSYNVYLRIESEVDSATASTSNLLATVVAFGTGTGGSNVRCASTGALEKLLVAQVKELLGDRK
jgi:hypothetical protein